MTDMDASLGVALLLCWCWRASVTSAACEASEECPKKPPDNVSRQYCQALRRGNSIEIILASLKNLLAEECSHLKYAMPADLLGEVY